MAHALPLTVPARPGLVRPHAVPAVSRSLAGVLAQDKIADWLEMYVKVMELDYWRSTTCTGASFNEESGEWSVDIDRDLSVASVPFKVLPSRTSSSSPPATARSRPSPRPFTSLTRSTTCNNLTVV